MASKTAPQVLLSVLWIYLSVNYIYCDHLGILEASVFKSLATGHIGTLQVTPAFLMAAAVLLQIPFAMIVFSRILSRKANRFTNLVASPVMIAVQLGTLGMGTAPTGVYIFYSILEIITNLIIMQIAWQWPAAEGDALAINE
jgi:hypothetical protein